MGEEKATRTRKTPAERAQAELDIAGRAVERLEDKAKRALALYNDTVTELNEAKDRLAYAKQNPALESFDADDYSDAEVEQAL